MSERLLPSPKPIREWHNVSRESFNSEIMAINEPAVLRGAVGHWPAVAAAKQSDSAARDYLARFDRGAEVRSFVAPPETEGRFFFRDDMSAFNFRVAGARFSDLLAAVAENSGRHFIYMGSTPTPEILPGFAGENTLDLVADKPTEGRIWIGTQSRIAAHFDESDNIACVVSGKRRFTVFPPEQVANLYVGPIDRTVAGQPTSMVDLANPDLERFPKYAEAAKHALSAELEPGDAIYIPAVWWHGVEASGAFNILVNYWWQDTAADAGSPMNALGAALLSIGLLPERKRQGWRAIFDHFVFGGREEAVAHIPPQARGILSESTPELRRMMREFLVREFRGK